MSDFFSAYFIGFALGAFLSGSTAAVLSLKDAFVSSLSNEFSDTSE